MGSPVDCTEDTPTLIIRAVGRRLAAVSRRDAYVWPQLELQGATGRVAFDENGHRRDFQLSVSELILNTDARPVYITIIMTN